VTAVVKAESLTKRYTRANTNAGVGPHLPRLALVASSATGGVLGRVVAAAGDQQ